MKIRMFAKKLELKILTFGRMADIFAMTEDFWGCRDFFLKIWFLGQFLRFCSNFLHVSHNSIDNWKAFSNIGSKTDPSLISWGGPPRPPPVGRRDIYIPWEVGLTKTLSYLTKNLKSPKNPKNSTNPKNLKNPYKITKIQTKSQKFKKY